MRAALNPEGSIAIDVKRDDIQEVFCKIRDKHSDADCNAKF
jgi:hypothetical protein